MGVRRHRIHRRERRRPRGAATKATPEEELSPGGKTGRRSTMTGPAHDKCGRSALVQAHKSRVDEVQRAAPKSKVLNRERARFEVAGGNYRLVVAFDFRRQVAFVKFIGTHAEYDRIAKRWPIDLGKRFDPIDVLNYAIDELGHTQAELAELLKSRSRASEILSRRRPLTVDMIHKISKA